MNQRSSCLVVLSGGQDSTTVLVWAQEQYEEVHAISFHYGQKHSIELESAVNVAKLCGVKNHHIVILPAGVLQGRSPLTDHTEELEKYSDYDTMDAIIGDRVEKTFVPMRNALFLTIAANYAVCNNIKEIATGVCQADNANYPDCRQVFVDSAQAYINDALGLYGATSMLIRAPLMNLSKAESIRLAASIEGGFEMLAFTHTAYDGKYPPTGTDHASTLRAHGFFESGMPDPLVLRAWSAGLMDLPNTLNYADSDFNRNVVDMINALKVVL
jgi:7-cyano-7-deazaguanine synthase